ncbi:MAG: S8 family peptidase [Lachnospiraceae bacterium]|nr:S8 family peptidase [Lachnospiraceae bacterium]
MEKDYMVSASTSEKKEAQAIQEVAKSQWNRKVVHIGNGKRSKHCGDRQKRIKVAVLDSGVSVTEDMEITERANLVDTEELSYICEDMTGHGTAVASVIAAKDNGKGTSGINERADIYSVKVLDDKNQSPVSRIIAGIQWCMDNGMDIVNMSFGMRRDSMALQAIIREAEQKGILLVAAAGNTGDQDNTVEYPAAYPEVLAVGSVTSQMSRAGDSARGEEVELAAPGECVPVTSSLGGVTVESGTSFAAPHVSAIAALLWEDCPSWDAQKIRAWMDAGARGLEDGDCGYGLVDYAYCKEIQDAFHRDYIPGNDIGELPDHTYGNETELKEYQLPEIAALWNSDGHNKLITTSLGGSGSWKAKYTADKIKVLQKVSYFVDTEIGTSGGVEIPLNEVKFMHAHGNTNYIAAVCYLYRLAILQHDNLTKPITTVMENCKQHYGLDSDAANFTKLRKAVNIICKGELKKGGKIPSADYGGTAGEKAGKNRCLRILGMAMHVAGDAYAHKAIVPNSAEVINYIKDKNNKENFYTQHTMTYTIPETLGLSVKTNCITMSGLSAYTIQGRDTQVHKVCADNPGFCPRRYQYGAQNVVETLLFQFSKKLSSFGITSFYNYGANKNNIFQYRLDKYAIQANGNKNPGNLNWSAYSGNKTK